MSVIIPGSYSHCCCGQAVAALAGFFRIKPEEILVAHDELDLPPGVAKLKQGGGHGGHNGLRDIIAQLGEYVRKQAYIETYSDTSSDSEYNFDSLSSHSSTMSSHDPIPRTFNFGQ